MLFFEMLFLMCMVAVASVWGWPISIILFIMILLAEWNKG